MLFLPIKKYTMHIIINNVTQQTAVIKDKTEIANYINQPIRLVRKTLETISRWEIGDYTVIKPDYVKVKSNSGGRRTKKADNDW